jgi:TRAP-type mannitol/chloroaromatic compound transport system permease small subunit
MLFRLKTIPQKIIAILLVLYSIFLILWNQITECGLNWVLCMLPFFAFMIYVKWQRMVAEYDSKHQSTGEEN